MPVKKIAISVPEDVVRVVDRVAAERGLTRSRFISNVLREVARARSDAEITRRIDRLLSDSALALEQVAEAEALGRAGGGAGLEW